MAKFGHTRDRVMNLATNIHNAAMLTRDLGETLGSVVDNVIGLTGLRFTNSEGAQVQFTDFLSSNFRAFLVSVLGAEIKLRIVRDIARTFLYMHSLGIVHRDIKSHNVLIDENFNIKVCDFGLARFKVGFF